MGGGEPAVAELLEDVLRNGASMAFFGFSRQNFSVKNLLSEQAVNLVRDMKYEPYVTKMKGAQDEENNDEGIN